MWRVNVSCRVRLQEVLPDRKRVTTRSYLPIQPVDSDTGRNYSCVATNLAVPTGKITTVTLNVHRKQFEQRQVASAEQLSALQLN